MESLKKTYFEIVASQLAIAIMIQSVKDFDELDFFLICGQDIHNKGQNRMLQCVFYLNFS